MTRQLVLRGIFRLWLIQLILTAGFCILSTVIYGRDYGVSSLLGGLVCIVPNIWFAIKLFKYRGAHAAKRIVNSFYKGEAGKIIISVILFAAVFSLVKVKPLFFFVSYILILITHWFAPLIIDNNQHRLKSD